jgi:hypothetical protein
VYFSRNHVCLAGNCMYLFGGHVYFIWQLCIFYQATAYVAILSGSCIYFMWQWRIIYLVAMCVVDRIYFIWCIYLAAMYYIWHSRVFYLAVACVAACVTFFFLYKQHVF